jgi:hypothetical protein
MVWPKRNGNYPWYELRRIRNRHTSLRASARLDWKPGSKIERYREKHRLYAGLLGEGPYRLNHGKRKRPQRACKAMKIIGR